jgi:hypothetical protein
VVHRAVTGLQEEFSNTLLRKVAKSPIFSAIDGTLSAGITPLENVRFSERC